MANALLYYRTPSTAVGTHTPEQILSSFPTQALEFTFPDDIMEGMDEDYKNNIKQIPI